MGLPIVKAIVQITFFLGFRHSVTSALQLFHLQGHLIKRGVVMIIRSFFSKDGVAKVYECMNSSTLMMAITKMTRTINAPMQVARIVGTPSETDSPD